LQLSRAEVAAGATDAVRSLLFSSRL